MESIPPEAIRAAFLKAAVEEPGPFRLSGRGHEPRVTLNRKTAAAVKALEIPRVHISGYGANYHYPLRLVSRAASLCGVATSAFTSWNIGESEIRRMLEKS